MSGYIGPIPVPQGIQNKETFTATAAQTTFNTNGYTDGAFISVYLNGVRLINGTDYTATNGSDFVLTQAASVSDVVDFESFNSFSLVSQTQTTPTFKTSATLKNDTHEDTDGGRESTLIFSGEQSGGEISTLAEIEASHDGTADDQKGDLIFKTNDGSDNAAPTERMRIDSAGKTTITVEGNGNALELISTDADASIGPVLEFKRNSASPADNDQIGRIDMVGKNDADEDVDYVVYVNQIRDATDGTEDGRMAINTVTNGAMISRMNVEPTETVFNDESNDVDFRVESDGNANMLFVAAGSNRVGIGVGEPTINHPFMVKAAANADFVAEIDNTGTTPYILHLKTSGAASDNNTRQFVFISDSAATRFQIDADGDVKNHDNSYGAISDERIKQDISDATSQWDDIKALKVRKYKLKDDIRQYGDDAKFKLGLVAQEAELVSPNIITENEVQFNNILSSSEFGSLYEDGDDLPPDYEVGDVKERKDTVKGIKYSILYMKAIKALQESMARIETLETKVAALEAE